MNTPRVLFEDNHLLVVEKPINMPVQEDSSKDLDLLNWCKNYIKEKYNKPGNVFIGLVHRLDRPVGGVMVFARTSKAASRLSEQIRENEMQKTYLAVVAGEPKPAKGELFHKLEKDERKNISRVSENGKESQLFYEVVATNKNQSLVKIRLITGRSHQIRVQFSVTGHPLIGDVKYGGPRSNETQLALWAHQLTFQHPTQKEQMTFSALPPKVAPWNLFDLESK